MNALYRFETLLIERITHSERRAVALLVLLNALIYAHCIQEAMLLP